MVLAPLNTSPIPQYPIFELRLFTVITTSSSMVTPPIWDPSIVKVSPITYKRPLFLITTSVTIPPLTVTLNVAFWPSVEVSELGLKLL